MLKLVNIKKDYVMSDEVVHAIKGVSVNFRRNEFVAILGPSGCGKTTLLNIVGGLDRYTSGDLIINGKSTKQYKDRDWDAYRNHSIGFVFQSYNLIGHITVLANVELALTLSGVGRKERRRRALDALKIVGLADKAKKRPNQLSGGQMQRVAIARALVNDPEILLADEPTGALDSETSVQVMDLLKEVAKDRLVIMVTHNPELAEEYATRIIKMNDGKLIHDSKPYEGEPLDALKAYLEKKNTTNLNKKTSMSFFTALGLSFNNMMTKKARTFLISFAGSIGIIGIALIMSVSFGFNNYISSVETDAMSTYPMVIYETSSSASLLDAIGNRPNHDLPQYGDDEEVVENSFVSDLLSSTLEINHSDTKSFKAYIESEPIQEKYGDLYNGIQYSYNEDLEIYKKLDITTGKLNDKLTNLTNLEDPYSYLLQAMEVYRTDDPSWTSQMNSVYNAIISAPLGDGTSIKSKIISQFSAFNFSPFTELLDNQELLNNQYDILSGHLPNAYNEVVITVNSYNEINDYLLFGAGVKDPSYLMSKLIYANMSQITMPIPGFSLPKPSDGPKFRHSFEDMLGLTFSVGLKTQRYKKVEDTTKTLGYYYEDQYSSDAMKNIIDNSLELKVVGIVRNKPSVNTASINGVIGYSPDLYHYLVEQSMNPSDYTFEGADVLKDQLANPTVDVLTGEAFETDLVANPDANSEAANKIKFGYVDESTPSEIRIYPKSFEAKEKLEEMIKEYNDTRTDKSNKVTFSDTVGALFSSFQTIIDSVGYVLIAFVSISLIVSSIMIGIITYVSVLERTKEIGVLRSVGARKIDISRVFDAETLITGLTAGLLGIGIAFLLDIPIMLIINSLTGLALVVTVPWYGALILPIISVILTLISGLIPASIAAKKDPVVALRSE